MRSFRKTTLPGVVAMLSPTTKASGAHIRTSSLPVTGSRSRRNCLMPLTVLAPPDSTAVRIASGLVGRKFVGASASVTCRAANPSRSWLGASSPATWVGSEVHARALMRYACFRTSSHGTSSQAGSRKRRSFPSGRATGSTSTQAMRAAPYAHSFPHDSARSSQVSARGDGSAASRDPSLHVASFRRSGSRNLSAPNGPAPGACRDPVSGLRPMGRRDVTPGSRGARAASAES